MNDTPTDTGEEPKTELISEKFKDLREALQVLYIRNNQSGRIHFTKSQPALANYILGHTLIHADTHGAEDKELRSILEAEAQTRRVELMEVFDVLEERSVTSGVLQVEYVEEIITLLGRDIALSVYSEKITNRFAPDPAPKDEPEVVESEVEDTASAPVTPDHSSIADTDTAETETVEADHEQPQQDHSAGLVQGGDIEAHTGK